MSFAHDVTDTADVRLSSHIQVIEITPEVFAFRRSLAMGMGPGQEVFAHIDAWPSHQDSQGFVDAQNLEKLLAHKPFDRLPLTLLSDEEKAELQRDGYHGVSFLYDAQERRPVDWLLGHAWSPGNVVRISFDQSQVFDLGGQPLPQAVQMDYIESRISNLTHDIPRLAAHLLARSDVRVCHKDSEWMDQTAASVEEAVFTIPRDADMGVVWGNQSVQFVWMPSAEAYQAVWNAAGREDWSYRASMLPEHLLALDELDVKQFELAAGA